ncbi:uncharacterized protein SCHCODRAFT_02517362 [Schizophyllum commune H4-8]|nr:uncharacterized protein SCHCODRAFT_02517362 [Schizophyllum commune H4-8]KAI5886535.1 hypothetical protein SCHCODRAFT_02517362 [Schizophyllum commune H4-8]
MGRRKVSNIAHYHRGTVHPNADGRKAGKGEARPKESKVIRGQHDTSLRKRTLEDGEVVIDHGKENHGPIKVPLKRRKTTKNTVDVALTARVTTQAATLASGHVPDPVLTASISEAHQVAQLLKARYLLPMPQSVIFQPPAYPASPSALLAAHLWLETFAIWHGLAASIDI